MAIESHISGEAVAPRARGAIAVNASNLQCLDYEALAASFRSLPYPIYDVHSHINGPAAARVYARAASLYGIGMTWSMTALEQVEQVREALSGRVKFIAMPDFMNKDRLAAHGAGFLKRIEGYHAIGCRIVKFWSAPRGVDLGEQSGDAGLLRLDSPMRLEAMRLASSLGMLFMTHVADPDTWFATRYSDRARYGSKLSHYDPLRALLDRFTQPWIAAHMGGWPEDLSFLDELLEAHPNLHLDCSATKWMVRELSRHSPEELVGFLERWRGRVLFGSDIVTSDDHLRLADGKTEMAAKSNSEDEAFDLYASRYWAYRTMFETSFDGTSPIADPDLEMIDAARFGPMDAPRLRGVKLADSLLRSLYHDAAETLLESTR